MKILVLSDKPLWPGTSGGALAVLASVRGLGDNGAKVDVVSAETDKHRSTEIRSVKNDSISGSYTTIRINTRINPFSLLLNLIFSNKPYNILRYRSGKFTSYLTYLLTKVDYDIIQIEGINMTVFIDLLRSKSKARISYRAHNVESEIWKGLASGERRHLIRIYYRILAQRLKKYESMLLGKIDLLVPISPEDSLYFNKQNANIPTFTCPFGISINEDTLKTAYKEGSDLVYIGSLDWRPNQEGLVWFINTVWRKVIRNNPEIKLRIAGRNAPSWLIDKLDIKGIEFIGETDEAEKFISSGKILIIPLLSGSGVRVRILQAMTLRVPVITTLKGLQGIKATSPEEILLAHDSDQFYEFITMLSSDKGKRHKLATKALSLIKKNYDNLKLNKALLDFYSNSMV